MKIKFDLNYNTPLTWRRSRPDANGNEAILMTCANGHQAELLGHVIGGLGEVSPSVQCPESGCAFHENVVLQDWATISKIPWKN